MSPMDPSDDAARVEAEVGHPGEKWDLLKARVQDEAVTRFAEIQDAWLDLVWTLDAYRVADVPPREMGKASTSSDDRLAAIYRGKGNWWAHLLALLLENQTEHKLAPRAKIQGFSQTHQIDVAWPDRGTEVQEDPLICLETKMTGAPAARNRPARGAMGDWSNRRKELKFAAADLKLYRRQQATAIEHWDVWRQQEMPMTFFLWAARMSPRDRISKMVREVQALVMTYLEGAGIYAWAENEQGTGYVPVAIPPADRVSTVDDVLYRIATQIRRIAPKGQTPPPPQRPPGRVLDVTQLEADE